MKAPPKGGSVISASKRDSPMDESRWQVPSGKRGSVIELEVSQTAMADSNVPDSRMLWTSDFHWALAVLCAMLLSFSCSMHLALLAPGFAVFAERACAMSVEGSRTAPEIVLRPCATWSMKASKRLVSFLAKRPLYCCIAGDGTWA